MVQETEAAIKKEGEKENVPKVLRFAIIEAFPKRFSREAELAAARTVLSTWNSNGEEIRGKGQTLKAQIKRAEFRSAEKNVSGTALRT